jgi:serine/threonine protein kinase
MFKLSNSNKTYQAEEVISAGKFGPVWLGKCVETKQKVIIKEYSKIHIDLAIKLAGITHPALQTGELAYVEDTVYIVRNYVEGSNLKELLTEKRKWKKLPEDFWVKGFVNLLDGLQTLHKNGIIHRDIKPSNIIIGHDSEQINEWKPEHLRLIDFEQSLILASSDTEERTPFALGYAPPEQLLNRNKLTGPWSDLFAFGVTLYEVLCRDKAFQFFDPEMMLHIQLNTPIINNGGIDEKLFAIILKATQKEAFRLPPSRLAIEETDKCIEAGIEKRYKSAIVMAKDLKQWLTEKPAKKTGWFKSANR